MITVVPIAGEQLRYKDECRVKHMLTQKYMAVFCEEENQRPYVYFLYGHL